ncbi:MAG: bifunctional riboflavin kinase/FAD synthetase [Desulfobacterales bacterium]|nr:bifunctional riboflavin kinase/FAD synthetase [Desulfobacterales bacterium]
MEVINGIKQIQQPFHNAVVTIGNFDGVHKGHCALFQEAIDRALKVGGKSIVITFEPHPLKVINKAKSPPLITLYEQKVELISETGTDVFICIPFTKEFSEINARSFVVDILINTIGMKTIVIGNDYHFGKNREGNLNLLKELSSIYGFDIVIPDWISIKSPTHERISSTKIREIVQQGLVERAPEFMGRFYQIRGKVVPGRKRGEQLLGIPTANILLQDELCPHYGVYAVIVEYQHKKYAGVANIGFSPTFNDHVFTVEVHILNFKKNIYHEPIKIDFIRKLRDEQKFSGLEQLSKQIKIDIEHAKTYIQL